MNSPWRTLVFCGATLMLLGCGDGDWSNSLPGSDGRENSQLASDNNRQLNPISTFTPAELSKAARHKRSLRLNSGVEMRPIKVDGLKDASEISLNFRSPSKIRGFTLYVFSSSPVEVSFEHSDVGITAWATNAPAANELSKELRLKGSHSEMIGAVLNEAQTEMGTITIKTSSGNLLNFYAEIPEIPE